MSGDGEMFTRLPIPWWLLWCPTHLYPLSLCKCSSNPPAPVLGQGETE